MQSETGIQIDPVCGAKIDKEEAERAGQMVIYEDTEYCFCSGECREEFQNAPHYFLTHTPGPPDYGSAEDWLP